MRTVRAGSLVGSIGPSSSTGGFVPSDSAELQAKSEKQAAIPSARKIMVIFLGRDTTPIPRIEPRNSARPRFAEDVRIDENHRAGPQAALAVATMVGHSTGVS